MIGWHYRRWPLLKPRRAAGDRAVEVLAGLGEAADQQEAVAREAGQILMQSQILMES